VCSSDLLRQKISNLRISENAFASFGVAILLLLVTSHGIATIWDNPDFIRNGADQYLELRSYLQEHDDSQAVIWIDRDNKRAFERVLPMYVRNPLGKLIWHGSFKYINTDNLYLRVEEITYGYVIVDRDFMVPDLYTVPDYLANPPGNWDLVFESQNKKIAMYEVNG
jgi:hypothetical protein